MKDPSDEEWLLARERGEDITHVPAETRATYDRLGRLFEGLPRKVPAAGWKERLLTGIDGSPRGAKAPRSRRRFAMAGGIASFAAALTIVIVLLGRRGQSEMTTSIVTTEIRRGNTAHRGTVHIGDTIVLNVEFDRPLEIRGYTGTGRLLARCTELAGCTVERHGRQRRLTFDIPLRVNGDLRILQFAGDTIPAPREDLDADLAAAANVDIQVRHIGTFHVQ